MQKMNRIAPVVHEVLTGERVPSVNKVTSNAATSILG